MLLQRLHWLEFATTRKSLVFLFLSFLSFLLFLFSISIAQAAKLEKSFTEDASFDANDFYQALAAEISNEMGDQHTAVDFYNQLSASNSDPAIAKRVTELATMTGQIAKALDGAKRWVVLNPTSLEANQYLALLNLRNSHFNAAAAQLDVIRNLIEITSDNTSEPIEGEFNSNESLTFIGAMLAAEAHHDKAYKVFKLYLKNHFYHLSNHKSYDKQRTLISAQLAMKAKQYEAVVNYLEALVHLDENTGLDEKNYVDAKVMHAKALHKLGKNKSAIKHLLSIQNHPQANDSYRLELVRLLVLTKQKAKALPILKILVNEHPKNLELLKSLIALQIDQSKLRTVATNIKLLAGNKHYVNESFYFSGEFAEKLGQQEKALSHYSKVEDGSYLKNAHKKIIHLTKAIEGRDALTTLFAKHQKTADSIKTQAYWYKLEADEFLESKKYNAALNLYNKAIRLVPKNSRYHFKRGLANERLGNIERAEADFKVALAKRKNDVEVLNAMGYMLSVHTNRLDEAKTYIDRAYKIKPNDPLVLDSLGFVFYKTGKLDQAEKYLRKSFSMAKKPEVASHLISVLAELKQYREAKSIYLEMRKKYPNSPSLKSVVDQLP